MNKANEVNKAQVALIKNIAEGGVELPTTNYALSEIVKDALLLRDFDAEESEAFKRCKIQFIKTAIQKVDVDGWVYISIIKNVLTRRAYFNDLSRSQAARDLDTVRNIIIDLMKDNVINRVGSQVFVTATAKDYLDGLENF